MQQTPYIQRPQIRLREPRKLMSTGYGNEIADVVNRGTALPRSGQVVESVVAPQVIESVGIHQSQVRIMRTDVQVGWELPFFAPADSSILP